MSTTEDTFFEGKRPWSVIKDSVIQNYIIPYINKVAKLEKPVLFIDAFAGPGIYEDGSLGSPIFICEAASNSKADWQAVFMNTKEKHHRKLAKYIHTKGWGNKAFPLLGDNQILFEHLRSELRDHTVFIYLDPFGLKGFDFQLLIPYLARVKEGYSTEIVVNMSMPTLHRHAASNAVQEGRANDPNIQKSFDILTRALGGAWWKEIMWTDEDAQTKENKVMERFTQELKKYLSYAGYCPVQETPESRVKYYITFASRHQDAQLLMNDFMCEARERYLYEGDGTQFVLWGWEEGRDLSDLDEAILATIKQHPNRTREHVWKLIVNGYFMRWTKKEYHSRVSVLAEEGMLLYPKDPNTGRHNKNCRLSLPT